MPRPLNPIQPTPEEIALYLAEDIGTGDITAALIPEHKRAVARVKTRDYMVLCGQAWFDAVFRRLDPEIEIEWRFDDGDCIFDNTVFCQLIGQARAILTAERIALNVLQTLSATATMTKIYANVVSGTGCKILDTRKTIPGLRRAQKYAVRCGGGVNHRMGLFDGVLIKENHIAMLGSIAQAVECARQQSDKPIEVEVENLDELAQALAARPDRIMLDNFSLHDLKQAVAMTQKQVELEASGNITLATLRAVAETGVDFISIGALTKHVQAIDLSMRTEWVY